MPKATFCGNEDRDGRMKNEVTTEFLEKLRSKIYFIDFEDEHRRKNKENDGLFRNDDPRFVDLHLGEDILRAYDVYAENPDLELANEIFTTMRKIAGFKVHQQDADLCNGIALLDIMHIIAPASVSGKTAPGDEGNFGRRISYRLLHPERKLDSSGRAAHRNLTKLRTALSHTDWKRVVNHAHFEQEVEEIVELHPVNFDNLSAWDLADFVAFAAADSIHEGDLMSIIEQRPFWDHVLLNDMFQRAVDPLMYGPVYPRPTELTGKVDSAPTEKPHARDAIKPLKEQLSKQEPPLHPQEKHEMVPADDNAMHCTNSAKPVQAVKASLARKTITKASPLKQEECDCRCDKCASRIRDLNQIIQRYETQILAIHANLQAHNAL